MPPNIRIIANPTGTAINYFLSGSTKTPYNGTGTPWTAQNTTPFRIAMNDGTGPRWTTQRAPSLPIYGGGAPFRNGRDLIQQNYDNVTEAIPIQIYATNHDNAVGAARELKRVLNLASYSVPSVLAVQPDGSTSTAHYDILTGDIDESPLFTNEEAGRGLYRCVLTLVRSWAGGRYGGSQTINNNVSMANNGTGTPNNFVAYGVGSGDMVYEGQPLNIMITVNAASTNTHFLLASVASRLYTAAGTSLATTDMIGQTLGSFTPSITPFLASKLKPRILVRVGGSPSANLEIRAEVLTGFQTTYLSPWRLARGGASAPANTLIDLGTWENNLSELPLTSGTYNISIAYRSTNGVITSGTLTGTEFLYYDTISEVIGLKALAISSLIEVQTYRRQADRAALPTRPLAYVNDSAGLSTALSVRGQPPRYTVGRGLWYAQLGSVNYDIVPTATATISVIHAPLYRTLIGGG